MTGIKIAIATVVATPVLAQAVNGYLTNDTIVVGLLLAVSAWFVRRDIVEVRAKLHAQANVLTKHALQIDRLERPLRRSDPPPPRAEPHGDPDASDDP